MATAEQDFTEQVAEFLEEEMPEGTTITTGKGKMKPVKSVSAEEADAIAKHVAGLKKP